MPWNHGLHGQALQIAATARSPLCVVAGPGTGKTFALMRRITRLIEVDKVDPERILACTFTRTAADDITRSVSKLGVRGADKIHTQTLHGFCFSMLSKQNVLAPIGRATRMLLEFEKRFLLQDLCKEGMGNVRDCGKQLRASSAAWARLQHEDPGWARTPSDKAFEAALLNWLLFHRSMLIDELIPVGIKYLRNNSSSPYRGAFDHLLVDEYQDLNRAEQKLLDLLEAGNIVVVGDEDQSIYSFKHAHPDGIVEFPKTHPNTEQAGLDICLRCPRRVVVMANELISHNNRRAIRSLQPNPGNPEGEIRSVQWTDMTSEAAGIATFIKSRLESGCVQAGNVLVLAPRREFGYAVRDELASRSVKAQSFFGEELLDGKPKELDKSQAQQAVTLLSLLADREDRVALRCWCGFGSASLAAQEWGRLRNRCETTGESPWLALERLADGGPPPLPRTTYIVKRFRELRDRIAGLDGLLGQKLLDAVLPSNVAWASPLAGVGACIGVQDFGPSDLADSIRSRASQPEMPVDVDFVRVMSLHKSKGLTADLVVVCGCHQGLIPSIDSKGTLLEQERSMEEQRRLFYVAITRTKQTLVLSSVARLPTAKAFQMGHSSARSGRSTTSSTASQFIHELGPECPPAVTGKQFLANTTGLTHP